MASTTRTAWPDREPDRIKQEGKKEKTVSRGWERERWSDELFCRHLWLGGGGGVGHPLTTHGWHDVQIKAGSDWEEAGGWGRGEARCVTRRGGR